MKKQVAQFVPYAGTLGVKQDTTGMSPVTVGNDGKLYYDKYAVKTPDDVYLYVQTGEANTGYPYASMYKFISGGTVDSNTPTESAYRSALEMKIGDKLHVIYENATLPEGGGAGFTLDIICEKTCEYINGNERTFGFAGYYVTPFAPDSSSNTVTISKQYTFSIGYKPDFTYDAFFDVIGTLAA